MDGHPDPGRSPAGGVGPTTREGGAGGPRHGLRRAWGLLRSSGSGAPFLLGRRAFLIVLGFASLAAFLSLGAQVEGLIGADGILPLAERLDRIASVRGDERFLLVPTVFWWDASDAALRLACGTGTVLSGLLVLGLATPLVLPLLFVLYLSLTVAGGPFLSFQWDGLLLESFLVAWLLGPARLSASRSERAPWRPAVLLVHLLVFKLMLSSGLVKLASGDPAWRGLSALDFHFWTQPLPHVLSWFAQQLPEWSRQVLTAAVLAIEIVLPFGIFGPRRVRHACGLAFLALQVGIAATGSYGFFGLLTAGLCLTLFDDRAWPSWARRIYALERRPPDPPAGTLRLWVRLVCGAALLALVPLMLARTTDAARVAAWPEPVPTLTRVLAPYRAANGYGLFAVMTTERRELVFSGSHDGQIWEPYAFRYKPGEPARAPEPAGLHMPRLDWQLWFAALGGAAQRPWVERFVLALLRGEPRVVALLEDDPFAATPPRFVRVEVWDYRFTTSEERSATGRWWVREPIGAYLPPVSLPAAPPPRRGARTGPADSRPAPPHER